MNVPVCQKHGLWMRPIYSGADKLMGFVCEVCQETPGRRRNQYGQFPEERWYISVEELREARQ